MSDYDENDEYDEDYSSETGSPDQQRSIEIEHAISEDLETPIRCDRYIAESLGLLSRSQIKSRLIALRVNGVPAKLSRTVNTGDMIRFSYEPPPAFEITPQPVPFTPLFENENVLVLDKPQGVVVHAGSGNESGTLVDGIAFWRPGFLESFPNDPVRPGIVHRLDKETSGVLIVAKSEAIREQLVAQFARREVEKRYLAIVKGNPEQRSGQVSGGLERDPHNRKRFRLSNESGKPSETRYRVIRRFRRHAFLELQPLTGRTHQLRVHMSFLRTPVLGDPLYARRDSDFANSPMMLHAYGVRIRLPGESGAREFCAPIPARFREMLTLLRQQSTP